MFIIEHNPQFGTATVRFTLDGGQTTVVDNDQAITYIQGCFLQRFLQQYLKHRYEALKRVHHPLATATSLAYGQVQSIGPNYHRLSHWIQGNQNDLIRIQPKRKNHWNEKIDSLFPQA